jgi:hypothetical protein
MLEAQLSEVQASLAKINASRQSEDNADVSMDKGFTTVRPVGQRTDTSISHDSMRPPPTSRVAHASPVAHRPNLSGSPHVGAQDTSQSDYQESGSDSESDNEDSEEDPLRNGATQAPLRDMVNAVASTHRPAPAINNKRAIDGLTPSETKSKKRSRLDEKDLICARLRAQILPFSRGGYSHSHLDPIALGILSETEAERLFAL